MSSGISSNGTSRQLLGLAMEAILSGVVVIDSSGQILLVNREAERLFRYEPSVLLGQPIEILLPERFRSRHPQLRNDYFQAPQARRMGSERELFGLRKDGSEFPVEIGLNPMETTEGTFVLASIVDITERFQAAETLARVQRLAALNLAEDASQARRRAEQAEERLNLALQSAGVGTWSWDVARDVITWDDFIPAIFGRETGELSPKFDDFIVMVHPDDRERVIADVRRTVDEGVPYDTDYRVFWPNGELHEVAARGKVYRDEQGQPVRMTGVCWDITKRRQTERSLKESQERFALAVEGSQDGIWDWNVLTNEVFYSPRWKSMLGYSDEEVTNQFSEWERLVHPDDLSRAKQALQDYFAGQCPDYMVEFRMRPKSGDWKWILARGVAQRDTTGAVVRMSGSHTDITGRKKTEQNLAAANAQLAGVLDASTQISIIATDLHGLITVFNTGAQNLLGYSADEMIGRQNPGVFHRADEMQSCGIELTRELGYPVEGFEVFVAYAKRGQHFHREWTYVRKDGSEFPVNLTITAVQEASGKITGYLGIAEDITERRRNEELVKFSERRMNIALNATRMGVWDLDLVHDTAWRSLRHDEVFGYQELQAEWGYEKFLTHVLSEDLDVVKRAFENAYVTDTIQIDCRVRWPDQSIHWIAAEGHVFRDERGAPVRMMGLITNIDERKKSEERFRATVEAAPTAIVMINETGTIVLINQMTQALFGYAREELVGQAVEVLIPERFRPGHPELRRQFLAEPQTRSMGAGRELFGLRKDGSEFAIEIGLGPFESDEGRFVIAGILDITERQEAHAVMTQQAEELARSNKELEQFAYIASHDLQEPLRKVQTFGDMLSTQAGPALDPTAQDYLKRMQNAAGRMQNFINDLLTYSRVSSQAKPFERVQLGQIAHEVIGDLEHRIQTTEGQVILGDLPALDADSLQLRQLLQNLIGNALKFHRPGVPPIVKVQSRIIAPPKGKKAKLHDSTPQCEITVQDNGIGFDEKYLDRIFAPFQRLHGRGEFEGTGIGLAICHKIVERHGGTITAKSVPGEGTTFIVRLPQNQTAEAPPHA